MDYQQSYALTTAEPYTLFLTLFVSDLGIVSNHTTGKGLLTSIETNKKMQSVAYNINVYSM